MARTLAYRNDQDFLHITKAGKSKMDEYCMDCGVVLRPNELEYGVCDDCLGTEVESVET